MPEQEIASMITVICWEELCFFRHIDKRTDIKLKTFVSDMLKDTIEEGK